MKYQHIVFDLDGTLIDTEKAILKTWQFTLKQYGYGYRLEDLKSVLGLTIDDTLKKLGVIADGRFDGCWMENYNHFAQEAVFFEGVGKMAATLKEQGYSLGIVTSRYREEYKNYFSGFHLESLFDPIVCADETHEHKPDPEPLLKYAALVNTDPSRCIYVGDMPTDVACAKRAGAAAGLAVWNLSSCLDNHADFIFHSPDELCKLWSLHDDPAGG